jgi:hypothetical protein
MAMIYTEVELALKLIDFWNDWRGPGDLVFAKVWGSYSHNCAREGSDLDFLAVYQMPTRAVLGLDDVQEDAVREISKGSPYDLEAHEIGKYCRLLLKGGPAMLECLFTGRLFRASMPFSDLMSKDGRARFLSRRAVKQYLGYAEGQIKRFYGSRSLHSKGGEATEKWAYHFARLATDAQRIASGMPPLVWKEGEEREALMRIRTGEASAEKVVANTDEIIKALRAEEANWKVPEEPDAAYLNDWLVKQRLRQIVPAFAHE